MRHLQLVPLIFFFVFFSVNAGGKTGASNLRLIYNGSHGLSSVVNDSSNVAMVVDYLNNLEIFVNGQSGVAILLDYKSNTAYQLDDTWKASNESFKQFFQGLTSLKPLLEIAKQKEGGTTITNPSKAIKDEIERDITDLAGSFDSQKFNIILKELINQLNGPLKLLYKGEGSFKLPNDIITFLELNVALGVWLAKADDVSLIGPLDLSFIFSDKTGLGTYLNFMEQIGDNADFSKVFGTILKDQDNFLRMIRDVEKAVSYDGMDGYDIVLTDIILLLKGSGTLRETINSLLKYNPNCEVSVPALVKYRDQFVGVVEKQLKTYKNYDSLGSVYDLACSKVNKTLVIRNVNITDVMNALLFNNFRDTFFYTGRALTGLLVPQNVPYLIQLILDDVEVKSFISHLFPILSGYALTAEDVLAILSEVPIVDETFPLILELLSNVTRTFNTSLHNDFKVFRKDARNASFGTDTRNFLWGLLIDVTNFVTRVLEQFGLYLGNPIEGMTH